ncbi:MAG TPA: hypothetical protein VHV57_15620 [Acidimicrobiales bacterium]|jgi:K+-sensing histidine kinase KdpD|nr:hypothetical protein [Acidimicrobiales bacterium]
MTASATLDPPASHPIRSKFGRRKFDKQPTQTATVLIASTGEAIPRSVIRDAVRTSEGGAVAVVTIARIYGSALGLPNPGLMPTRKEMNEQRAHVEEAIRLIEKAGAEAWGQVAATRKSAKTIAEAAVARGVAHVIVVRPEQPRWREVVEGNLVKEVAKKLGPQVKVVGVSPDVKGTR